MRKLRVAIIAVMLVASQSEAQEYDPSGQRWAPPVPHYHILPQDRSQVLENAAFDNQAMIAAQAYNRRVEGMISAQLDREYWHQACHRDRFLMALVTFGISLLVPNDCGS